MKFLVCLPFYSEDRKQVEEVASLICDLLEQPTELCDIAFIQRFDAPPPSWSIQEKCKHKFENVIVWKCDRVGVGFPGGCNEMAYGILNWIPLQRHLFGKFKDIAGLLILEGDCVVLRKNWDKELMELLGKMLAQNRSVAGTVIPKNEHTQEHVNAVALYDSMIAQKLPNLRGGPQNMGWDAYHGPIMVSNNLPNKLFKLDYKRKEVTAQELFMDPDVLIYHGVKDTSAVKLVREKLKI